MLDIFPEQLSLIDDAAAAHVKYRNGDHGFLSVIAEDIDVVEAHDSHFLPLGKLLHGLNGIAIMRSQFELLGGSRFVHFLAQSFDEVDVPPIEKQLHVLDGLLVLLTRRKSGHARPKATMDIVLQARPRSQSVDGDVAIADQKVAFNQLYRFARKT